MHKARSSSADDSCRCLHGRRGSRSRAFEEVVSATVRWVEEAISGTVRGVEECKKEAFLGTVRGVKECHLLAINEPLGGLAELGRPRQSATSFSISSSSFTPSSSSIS